MIDNQAMWNGGVSEATGNKWEFKSITHDDYIHFTSKDDRPSGHGRIEWLVKLEEGNYDWQL